MSSNCIILFANKKAPEQKFGGFFIGGWGEIRTHGTLSRSAVFKTAALNRSATHPYEEKTIRQKMIIISFLITSFSLTHLKNIKKLRNELIFLFCCAEFMLKNSVV